MKLGIHPISWVGLCVAVAAIPLWVLDIFLDRTYTVASVLGADAPGASTALWLVIVILGALIYLVGRVLEVVGKFREHRAGR